MPFHKQENGVGRLSGDLHISDVDELRSALLAWLHDPSATELDLTEVERCDIANLQLLVSLSETARSIGQPCCMSPLPPAMQEINGILGFPMVNEGVAPHDIAE
jgi:anti-anti-sigma regulatory factor